MAALADVRKKWHIPPAFSVEFIGYYLDRISRIKEITGSLQEQLESNKTLVDEQQKLRDQYDQVWTIFLFAIDFKFADPSFNRQLKLITNKRRKIML